MPNRLLRLLCALVAITVFLHASALGGLSALADKEKKTGSPWNSQGKTRTGLQGTEVNVYTYNLNVYEKPSKKTDVLEIVPFAKRILLIEEQKGWAKVFTTNGRLGFCNAKQLTDEDPNIYGQVMYCQQNRAPVYLRPSLDSPLLGHLDRDEKTIMFAITPKHDWVRIQNGKHYAYIQRPRLDYSKYSDGKDAWINEKSVDIYYDPDIDAVFNTSYFGQHVRLMDVNAGWAKIRSDGGLIGYCDATTLTDIDPNSLDIRVYTQVEGSYLYTSSSDLGGHRPIAANVEMLLSAVDDDLYWARVRYQDQYFYVPYVFLSTEKRTGDYKRVRAKSDLSIYQGTTAASGVLTNVPAGTELWLIGCLDNRAKVATDTTDSGSRFIGFVDIDQII